MKKIINCLFLSAITSIVFWLFVAVGKTNSFAAGSNIMPLDDTTKTATIFYLTEDDNPLVVPSSLRIKNTTLEYLNDNMGYYTYVSSLPSIATAKMTIAIRDVVVFSCHGRPDELILSDGNLTSDSIPSTANYDECKLLYLSVCHLAADDSNGDNLCASFIDAGVGSIVGMADYLGASYAEALADTFFPYITNGYTIADALTYSFRELGSEHKIHIVNTKIFGDGTITLN